jgi:hypothetical protein
MEGLYSASYLGTMMARRRPLCSLCETVYPVQPLLASMECSFSSSLPRILLLVSSSDNLNRKLKVSSTIIKWVCEECQVHAIRGTLVTFLLCISRSHIRFRSDHCKYCTGIKVKRAECLNHGCMHVGMYCMYCSHIELQSLEIKVKRALRDQSFTVSATDSQNLI